MGKEAECDNTRKEVPVMAEGADVEDQHIIDCIRARLEGNSSYSSSEVEWKEDVVPVTASVAEFLSLLRETPEYRGVIDQRTEEMKRRRKVVEGEGLISEIQETFETTDTFRAMIIDFGQDCLHLKYDLGKYPPEFVRAMEEYSEAVMKGKAAHVKKDADALADSDHRRGWAHGFVGKYIQKTGVVRDSTAAKALARLLLIDQGLDYIANARRSGVANYYGIPSDILGKSPGFSTETRKRVQERMLELHPDQMVEFVERKRYIEPPTTLPSEDTENLHRPRR